MQHQETREAKVEPSLKEESSNPIIETDFANFKPTKTAKKSTLSKLDDGFIPEESHSLDIANREKF